MAVCSHTVFLIEDGTVKSVGLNDYSQLGLGYTTTSSPYGVLTISTIPNLSGVRQVACGSNYTIFLMEDGTVKSVGNNGQGQLGLGNTTTPITTVSTIPNLSGVKQVACGQYYSVFLMEDGTVKSVGYNASGQLGLGNTTQQTTPQNIPNLSGVKQVACGDSHTIFLMEDGTVKSVGLNSNGQLGLGNTTTPITTVSTIPNLSGVKQVACGGSHTIFLMEDGTVKSVGLNSNGQLGLGNTTNQSTPQNIPNLSNVKQVACGYYHTIFLMEDGTVKSVGLNSNGQLGLGNTTNQSTPQNIPNLSNVKQVIELCMFLFLFYLIQDGDIIKSVQNGELISIGIIPPTPELFKQYGVKDLSEFVGDVTETLIMEDKGILGEGKVFSIKIPQIYDYIYSLNVKG